MSTALNFLLAARRCEVEELSSLARTCELICVASELIHCLQHERGASNLFLASQGKRYAALRSERIQATGVAYNSLLARLVDGDQPAQLSGGVRLYTKIAMALHALDELPNIRGRVGELLHTPATVTAQYRQVVEALLALIFEAADVAVDPDISRLLVALFHLMQGKEWAGQERATGAAAYAAGRISAEQVQTIEYLTEMQEQALQRFELFASAAGGTSGLKVPDPGQELLRMRQVLLESVKGSLQPDNSDAWFDACTQRMDGFHGVEMQLATRLKQLCEDKIRKLIRGVNPQEQDLNALETPEVISPLNAFATGLEPEKLFAPLDGQGNGTGPVNQALLDVLRAQSDRLHHLTEELNSVKASLDERKVIERAKGILMMHRGLDEESAYRMLRKTAMDQNRKLAEVARSVLSLADLLPGGKAQ
ncbi:nitrate- and nitrite sensing domain-containing protein [Limnobacter sp.]|uniref:nitrate- and nitrite sensing domain-containing protein n=1 Tax=Limnobacter sp. TaxID=2003368 RepID=UPI0035183C69